MSFYLIEYHLIVGLLMHHLSAASMLCAQGPILLTFYELTYEISKGICFKILVVQVTSDNLSQKVNTV